ncbi:CWC16 protein [Mycotypha africana]|uniref:CWC16 protein n=1 Tax=Mycotypha africana TaxID=64632 RepID=UPI00230002B0|nr:CWC16 protein [Mycotypha africana]KAI8975331.1 CWC16 protein [Mycotypha africana]
MSERKVLNKYFPPNFDPSQIPRQKKPKDQQHKVRLMSPFSMRCESCGEYIYKGKKFNARKETVEGETYLNIKIYRFYIRCPRCSAEITFKTDPKNTDYVAENGASRNFEPWREEKESESEEEENDPMQSLENRTLDSKREMDIMDALDEIRTRNARSERIDVDEVLNRFSEADQKVISERIRKDEEELEKEAKAVFESADGQQVRKLKEPEPEAISLVRQSNATAALDIPSFKPAAIIKKRKQNNDSPVVVVKKKKDNEDNGSTLTSKKINNSANGTNALSLLANYDNDSESSSD